MSTARVRQPGISVGDDETADAQISQFVTVLSYAEVEQGAGDDDRCNAAFEEMLLVVGLRLRAPTGLVEDSLVRAWTPWLRKGTVRAVKLPFPAGRLLEARMRL